MARSAEKAVTALARFRKMKMEEGKIVERRPFIASNCNSLHKCEKWRRQILGEISRKVSQIQNAGLPDTQVRGLNDDINKLIREKRHWEDHILTLGGPDYKRTGPKMLDHDGKEVPGNRGYKYFGAAKDLPGVRELLTNQGPAKVRKTRGQLMKGIDADYYGYRDEDDGVIVPLEDEAEQKAIEAAVEEWKLKELRGEANEDFDEEEEEDRQGEVEIIDEDYQFREVETQEGARPFVSHVPVPSQQDIKDALLRKKKLELLERYASETLQAQSAEAHTLLG